MEIFELDKETLDDFLGYVKDEKLTIKRKSRGFVVMSDGNKYLFNKDEIDVIGNIGGRNSGGSRNKSKERPREEVRKVESQSSSEETKEVISTEDIIHGKDKTPKVTAVEIKGGKLHVHFHNGEMEERPLKYWSLTKAKQLGSLKLKGNQAFKYLNEFDSLDELKEFNKKVGWKKYYSPRNPIMGEMIRSGLTMYGSLTLQDLSVLSSDIETSGLQQDSSSYVYCIGNVLRDRKGKVSTKLFTEEDYQDDKEMIEAWEKWVQEVDPDIIVGHNFHGYDLPYLEYCNGGSLKIGKFSYEMEYAPKRNFRVSGDEKWELTECMVYGRQVVDTMLTSVLHDFKKDYPTWRLKPIIDYETKKADMENPQKRSPWQKSLLKRQKNRQHYDAGSIVEKWKIKEEREKIKKYCLDDCYDALDLFDLQITPYFYYTQYVPMTLQEVIASGTGAQIDGFLVRSYLQEGYSIPETSKSQPVTGGISMGVPNVYRHVYKVDVASLYPSIIISEGLYCDKKDPNAHFLKMVKYFTEMRLEYKAKAAETGSQLYDDIQQAFKIIINSAYGVNGTNYLCFNNFKIADTITSTGRAILETGVTWASGKQFVHTPKLLKSGEPEMNKKTGKPKMEWKLKETGEESKGFSIVNVDTDSFSFSSGKKISDDDFAKLIDELNTLYKEGIVWEDDGYYAKFAVLKAKNYILEKSNGKRSVKGSALTDTKKEKNLQEFGNKIIDCLMKGRRDHVFDTYRSFCKGVLEDFEVEGWLKRYKLSEAVLNASRKQEQDVKDAIMKRHPDAKQGEKFFLFRKEDGTLGFDDEFNG